MTSSDCSSCDVGRAFRLGFAPSRVRSFSLFRKKRDRLALSRRSQIKSVDETEPVSRRLGKDATFRSRSFSRLRAAAEKMERDIFADTGSEHLRTEHSSGFRLEPIARQSKSARTPQRASASLARAPQGRSARNADAVEASGSPRERARGTGTRGTSRGVRRPAVLGPGEAASRDARRELIAAGARARDRGRPTRGLPSRFQ